MLLLVGKDSKVTLDNRCTVNSKVIPSKVE
jgi:hypothetical protein